MTIAEHAAQLLTEGGEYLMVLPKSSRSLSVWYHDGERVTVSVFRAKDMQDAKCAYLCGKATRAVYVTPDNLALYRFGV